MECKYRKKSLYIHRHIKIRSQIQFKLPQCCYKTCHTRVDGNLTLSRPVIPACAGMTESATTFYKKKLVVFQQKIYLCKKKNFNRNDRNRNISLIPRNRPFILRNTSFIPRHKQPGKQIINSKYKTVCLITFLPKTRN